MHQGDMKGGGALGDQQQCFTDSLTAHTPVPGTVPKHRAPPAYSQEPSAAGFPRQLLLSCAGDSSIMRTVKCVMWPTLRNLIELDAVIFSCQIIDFLLMKGEHGMHFLSMRRRGRDASPVQTAVAGESF